MRSPWRAAAPAPERRARAVRLAVRTFSEVCLTAGTVIVLFVAYLLLWTGVRADRAAAAERERL
ncbi:hypothetical protein LG632_01750, partial [Streptomyces sp. SMC 277]|nr:hypothetical protein [Streptomyces antimicrobicus]